jgi:hypothetical protein
MNSHEEQPFSFASVPRLDEPGLFFIALRLLNALCPTGSAAGQELKSVSFTESGAGLTGVDNSSSSIDGEINLDWNAVGEADSYRVHRSTSSVSGASGGLLDTGVSSTGYTDETAENGTKYFYVVTAVVSENGESAESDPSNEVETPPS